MRGSFPRFVVRGTWIALIAAVGLGVLLTSGHVAMASEPPGAWVRTAHAWPQGGTLTVEIDDPPIGSPLTFGVFDDYRVVPSGEVTVVVRADDGVATTSRVSLGAGASHTVVVRDGDVGLIVDDLRAPATGHAGVRLLHLAPDVGPAGLSVGGRAVGPPGTEPGGFTAYASVPAGVATAQIIRDGSSTTLIELHDVELLAGVAYTVAVIGGADEPVRAVVVRDAFGLSAVPEGYPATGVPKASVSGTTGSAGLIETASIAALLIAVVCVGCVAARRGDRAAPAVIVLVAIASLIACSGPQPIDDAMRSDGDIAPSSTGGDPSLTDHGDRSVDVDGDASVEGQHRDSSTGELAPLPVRIQLPAGRAAPVVPLGLQGSGSDTPDHLEVPSTAHEVGWFVHSPSPGQPGPAVLTAHVDYAGRAGAFSDLAALQPGDLVTVELDNGGSVTFTVTRLERYHKTDFAHDVVYAPTPGPALVLITCGGPFVDGEYRDNVVAYAILSL